MRSVLVTGCAGFIGSTLTEELLSQGYHVIGVDALTENYEAWVKEKNMSNVVNHPLFQYIESDLRLLNLSELLQNVDVVFHQAAMPGVRSSWGADFQQYVNHNVSVTQKLLEAVKESRVQKIIYASSSSIYGSMVGPTKETQTPAPYSPYGVTKLAAEHLCQLYFHNYRVPVVSLRYFTVYGPRQRPDMAFHRFIHNMLTDKPITVYGDGQQTRDYTYIRDAVQANLLAMEKGRPGQVYNIGGSSRTSLNQVIEWLGEIMNKRPQVINAAKQPGDPQHTWANIDKAGQELGYNPAFPLKLGLHKQVEYIQALYGH